MVVVVTKGIYQQHAELLFKMGYAQALADTMIKLLREYFD
tara:strand:- start:1086 stop:1205 length:120 start_codon:yes stop_codon:yes gene_type:complete